MYNKIFTVVVLMFLMLMSKAVWADYLDLSVSPNAWDNSILGIGFNADEGDTFKVKLRKVGESSWNVLPEIHTTDPDVTYSVSTGRIDTNLGSLECGTEYQVKVKRIGKFYRSSNATTRGCGVEPCPYGGYFDQSHCQIGQAPAGTEAFILNDYYYYTPINTNLCPYPGSWFDQENCQVQQVPSGVTPFIHLNHWYYIAYP